MVSGEHNVQKYREDRHVKGAGSLCNERRAFRPIVRRDFLILVRREI